MRPELEKSPECGLPPATRLWDFLFPSNTEKRATNDPIRCEVPALRGAEIVAVYYDQRRAGDFYEFVRAGKSRCLRFSIWRDGERTRERSCVPRKKHSGKLQVSVLAAKTSTSPPP